MATKFAIWLIPLFLVASSAAPQAQENATEPHSITGCFHQGVETGGYYLDSHDGKMWELRGDVDKRAIGHEVTVEGYEHHISMSPQAELVTDEKQEANGRPYQGFEVTNMKTLSNSCR